MTILPRVRAIKDVDAPQGRARGLGDIPNVDSIAPNLPSVSNDVAVRIADWFTGPRVFHDENDMRTSVSRQGCSGVPRCQHTRQHREGAVDPLPEPLGACQIVSFPSPDRQPLAASAFLDFLTVCRFSISASAIAAFLM